MSALETTSGPHSGTSSRIVEASYAKFYQYEGVILDTCDPDKLVLFVDQLLFYCRVPNLRTHPVKIQESEGVVSMWWSRYAPAVFRRTRLIDVVAAGQCIDNFTIQESLPLRRAA